MQIRNKLHPLSHRLTGMQLLWNNFPPLFLLPSPSFTTVAPSPHASSLFDSRSYQSTNCSTSQLYRYLINYKRAIAAVEAAPHAALITTDPPSISELLSNAYRCRCNFVESVWLKRWIFLDEEYASDYEYRRKGSIEFFRVDNWMRGEKEKERNVL